MPDGSAEPRIPATNGRVGRRSSAPAGRAPPPRGRQEGSEHRGAAVPCSDAAECPQSPQSAAPGRAVTPRQQQPPPLPSPPLSQQAPSRSTAPSPPRSPPHCLHGSRQGWARPRGVSAPLAPQHSTHTPHTLCRGRAGPGLAHCPPSTQRRGAGCHSSSYLLPGFSGSSAGRRGAGGSTAPHCRPRRPQPGGPAGSSEGAAETRASPQPPVCCCQRGGGPLRYPAWPRQGFGRDEEFRVARTKPKSARGLAQPLPPHTHLPGGAGRLPGTAGAELHVPDAAVVGSDSVGQPGFVGRAAGTG